MEHYNWNNGWQFTPVFDPALLRPSCPELELTPVRIPHTVKTLPFNYCNENDYQMVSGLPVSSSYASLYLSMVLSITSCGRL